MEDTFSYMYIEGNGNCWFKNNKSVGVDEILNHIKKLTKENEELKIESEQWKKFHDHAKEELRFYAKYETYRSKYGGHVENKNFSSAIGRDCGLRARKFLKKWK